MSALGQKHTCAVREGMSALPPKADVCAVTVLSDFGSRTSVECRKSKYWCRAANWIDDLSLAKGPPGPLAHLRVLRENDVLPPKFGRTQWPMISINSSPTAATSLRATRDLPAA